MTTRAKRVAAVVAAVTCFVLGLAVPDRGLGLILLLAGWYFVGVYWVLGGEE